MGNIMTVAAGTNNFTELYGVWEICLQCFDAVGLAAGRASGL